MNNFMRENTNDDTYLMHAMHILPETVFVDTAVWLVDRH